MFKNKNVVCLIPARGGSKGLPGKNIRPLIGKPLIGYSIEQAKASRYIDRVIVSTEDPVIARIARSFGAEVPFRRPRRLAGDRSSGMDVLIHAVNWIEAKDRYDFDLLVLLHATAPLRTVDDIDAAIELLHAKNYDNVFSVTEAYRNPYFNMVEIDRRGHVSLVKKGSFVTRQSAPPVYDMNASIYVWRKDVLQKTRKVILKNSGIYVMPRERSVDIDNYMDFRMIEMLMREKAGNPRSGKRRGNSHVR